MSLEEDLELDWSMSKIWMPKECLRFLMSRSRKATSVYDVLFCFDCLLCRPIFEKCDLSSDIKWSEDETIADISQADLLEQSVANNIFRTQY